VLEKVFSEKELNDDAVSLVVAFHWHAMIETCVGMQGHPRRHQTEVHGRFWRGYHERILVAQLSYLEAVLNVVCSHLLSSHLVFKLVQIDQAIVVRGTEAADLPACSHMKGKLLILFKDKKVRHAVSSLP